MRKGRATVLFYLLVLLFPLVYVGFVDCSMCSSALVIDMAHGVLNLFRFILF